MLATPSLAHTTLQRLVPHHGIDLWLQIQIFYDHVNPITRQTINQSTGGKLRDLNPEESWEILEDLALYDNESWNDPRDFAKSIKAIALPQDVPSTSDRRLIELENQVQCLMEAYLAQPVRVNEYIFSLRYRFRNPFSLTTMADENPIQTLEDYSKPSHEGYMNTIELPVGNNMVPLRSDTIRLVQNGCSFYGLWSEDPNQHLKDFLKLVD
nr:MAK10-like protein [Tanacetum cinerariifolium]